MLMPSLPQKNQSGSCRPLTHLSHIPFLSFFVFFHFTAILLDIPISDQSTELWVGAPRYELDLIRHLVQHR